MITVMRGYVAAGAALLLLAGCSSEPSEAEQRAADCEGFAQIEPGFFETQRDSDILADPNASTEERSAALKRQLDARAGIDQRTHPYDCDVPADQKFFEQYRQSGSE